MGIINSLYESTNELGVVVHQLECAVARLESVLGSPIPKPPVENVESSETEPQALDAINSDLGRGHSRIKFLTNRLDQIADYLSSDEQPRASVGISAERSR